MKRSTLKIIHPFAGGIALLTILTFWITTLWSKIDGNPEFILNVKTGILYGMVILIPAMITVGASGFKMGGKSTYPLIVSKKRRMPIIGINGVFILLPCAVSLHWMASSSNFSHAYYFIQWIEIIAGALNITLLSLSMRDGLKLTKKI